MPNNNLILRTLISPWITPTPDITKSSVLKHIDVDNNFIYLRGELIYSATTVGNLVTLKKINGNDLSFNVGSGGGSDYWTSGSTGFYSIKTINDSGLDATGNYSVAQGFNTLASGNASHSGGVSSTASGLTSFIHSTNSLVTGDRSVVLGGQNITGATDDTVYVPNLNINNIGGTTSVTNLGIDSNGNVVSGSTEPDSITFEIFNTSPTSPDPYTIYDDGNIRLLFDEAATDDIEIVVLTNPSTGPVHVVWSEPTAGTSGSANVTTASGQIPLNTEVSADDVVDFVIWAPEDATYPYYEAKVTVSNGTFTSIPAVARVSKWNTPS